MEVVVGWCKCGEPLWYKRETKETSCKKCGTMADKLLQESNTIVPEVDIPVLPEEKHDEPDLRQTGHRRNRHTREDI
jgi:hypothetical protein